MRRDPLRHDETGSIRMGPIPGRGIDGMSLATYQSLPAAAGNAPYLA